MACPYLQETTVVSCRHAGFRTALPGGAGGLCASDRYALCDAWGGQAPEATGSRCPYLQEARMQFCAAAAVRKFVPPSKTSRPRCARDAYFYCALYLDAAGPEAAGPEQVVDGIRVPERLLYSPNHMWMDLREDGRCHLGIDGFLARTLGCVEQVSFLADAGVGRPAAVLTARGVDLQVIFPHAISMVAANCYLRADPGRLARFPYSLGWLFEGCEEPPAPVRADLIDGRDAPAWIAREVERMRQYPPPRGRQDLLRMLHDFFSPLASRELER